jgi:hypothetical protein
MIHHRSDTGLLKGFDVSAMPTGFGLVPGGESLIIQDLNDVVIPARGELPDKGSQIKPFQSVCVR